MNTQNKLNKAEEAYNENTSKPAFVPVEQTSRFKITNDERLKELRIRYTDEKGKEKTIKKRYTRCGLEKAMFAMKLEREKLIKQFCV